MDLSHDPQQQKCYDFEANFVEPHDGMYLSVQQIRDMVRKISQNFGIIEPHLKFKKTNAHCRAYVIKNLIVITQWGRTPTTILHELAHIIDYQMTKGRSGMGHGPVFMGISIFLYSEFLGLDYQKLYYSALNMGLKVAPVGLSAGTTQDTSSDFFDDDF